MVVIKSQRNISPVKTAATTVIPEEQPERSMTSASTLTALGSLTTFTRIDPSRQNLKS